MEFETWLKKHKKHKDALGELARDFINTGCHSIEESFLRYTPCESALKTYKEARRSYILELATDLGSELVVFYSDRVPQETIDMISTISDQLSNCDENEEDE